MNCFVIMPIQNPETEFMWEDVYRHMIGNINLDDGSNLAPVRIDQADDGTLLPAQIIHHISNSQIIIADLTLSRPNCYLEVGYAMGINKYSNLILCCREDHNPDSQNFPNNNHKVHFDIQSYGILWWDKNNLEQFKNDLIFKIRNRLRSLELSPVDQDELKTLSTVELDQIKSQSQEELRKWKK